MLLTRPAGSHRLLLLVLLGCPLLPRLSCSPLSRGWSSSQPSVSLRLHVVCAEDWLERVTPQELQAALLPLIQASLSGDGGGTVAAASLGSGGTALLVTEQASALVLYQHVQ